MWDLLCTVKLEQFLKTLPQNSHVSLRPREISSLRVWGSNKASSLPFCAKAWNNQGKIDFKFKKICTLYLTLIALGSIGGKETPGGKGGTGNWAKDLLPPLNPPLPRPPVSPPLPGNIPSPPWLYPVGFQRPRRNKIKIYKQWTGVLGNYRIYYIYSIYLCYSKNSLLYQFLLNLSTYLYIWN